jgi:hypothetical protein
MELNIGTAVETNIKGAVEFKLSSNASKIFAALGNFLYSNKELCVLHELSANAVDAHRMVGKQDVPFSVTLPTKLDSNLRVRDYGPGLSEDSVYNLLSTYGESTKQGENDSIGGFGIGSKSPASITETWTVRSHHGGELKDYLVFIGATGIPSITMIRAVPSDETGIEVVIPVQSDKAYQWKQLAATAYRHYTPHPIVHNTDITIAPITNISSGANWVVCNSEKSSRLTVVTSFREYPISDSELSKIFAAVGMDSVGQQILKLPIIMYFNIGELDLSLSRETLQYTKKTIDALSAMALRVKTEIIAKMVAITSTSTDSLDLRVNVLDAFQSVLGISNDTHRFRNFSGVFPLLGLNSADDVSVFFNPVTIPSVELDKIKVIHNGQTRAMTNAFNCWRTYSISREQRHNNQGVTQHGFRFKISVLNRVKLVIADCSDALSRVRNASATGGGGYYVVSKTNLFHADLQKYVINASTLDKVARAPRVAGTKTAAVVTDLTIRLLSTSLRSCTKTEYDKTEKYCHVIVTSYSDLDMAGTIGVEARHLQDLGYSIIVVKNVSELPDKSIPTTSVALKSSYDRLAALNLPKKKADYENTLQFRRFFNGKIMLSFFSNVIGAPIWDSIVSKYNTASYDGKEFHTFNSISNFYKIPVVPYSHSYDQVQKDLTLITETYKMVKHLSTCASTGDMTSDLTEYLLSVGK